MFMSLSVAYMFIIVTDSGSSNTLTFFTAPAFVADMGIWLTCDQIFLQTVAVAFHAHPV